MSNDRANLVRRLRYPNVDPAGMKALRLEAAELIEALEGERDEARRRIMELEGTVATLGEWIKVRGEFLSNQKEAGE